MIIGGFPLVSCECGSTYSSPCVYTGTTNYCSPKAVVEVSRRAIHISTNVSILCSSLTQIFRKTGETPTLHLDNTSLSDSY
jgi:hypothetical protein